MLYVTVSQGKLNEMEIKAKKAKNHNKVSEKTQTQGKSLV